jgi:RecA/RadA recombinase
MTSAVRDALLKRMKDVDAGFQDKYRNFKKRSTGSLYMDKVLGGGYPSDSVIELFGEPGSIKTTMSLFGARAAIERGEPVAYLNLETSYSADYCEQLGVDIHATNEDGDPLFELPHPHGEPKTDKDGNKIVPAAEEWLQLLIELIRAGYHKFIIIDTIAKLVPRAELEADMDKAVQLGVHAKMMTRLCRVIGPYLLDSGIIVIALNQVRVNIGGWAPTGQIAKTSMGGKGFHHEAMLQLCTESPGREWDKEGNLKEMAFRFKIKKTKCCNPSNKIHEVFIQHDIEEDFYEIQPVKEVFEVAKMLNLFQTSKGEIWKGTGTAYFPVSEWGYEPPALSDKKMVNVNGALKLENGEAKIQEVINADVELFDTIHAAVRAHLDGKVEGKQHETPSGSEQRSDSEDAEPFPEPAQAGFGFE